MADIVRRTPEVEPQRWDPFELMREISTWDPFQRMERAFAPLVGRRVFTPSFDVRETPDAYIFKADLPGMKDEDVEISLTGHRLSVSGRRQEEERREGDTYYTVERSYGSFSRTFTIPEGADVDRVTAELKEGELTVVVPKQETVKPKRISLKGLKETVKEKLKA